VLEAGERDDYDRLESLGTAGATWRLRVANELSERDGIDGVALSVVDLPAGEEAVPTQEGNVIRFPSAAPPRTAADARGRDALDLVREADGRAFQGRADDHGGAADPRAALELEFPRGPGSGVLLLRTRCTALAAEAFTRYLTDMGGATLALLHWAEPSTRYPYLQRLTDEYRKMGLVLAVRVRDGERWNLAAELMPIGPAVPREVAIPFEMPAGADDIVRLRVELAPLLWEVDRARLARGAEPAQARAVAPRLARRHDGRDVTAALCAFDGTRAVLEPDEWIDLEFDSPPAPAETVRTVVLRIRGYYLPLMTNPRTFHPLRAWDHIQGSVSLPRFALEMARAAEATEGTEKAATASTEDTE